MEDLHVVTELKKGQKGDAVALMQACLCRSGFNTYGVDGDFGPGTEMALRRFQQERRLYVSGICTAQSRTALRMDTDDPLHAPVPVIAAVNVATVRRMFPRQTPRANIAKYLPPVLDALFQAELDDQDLVLMALATIRAESEGFEPIDEMADGSAYEGRADLGNIHEEDGKRYKRRGFVQLTGRGNYVRYGKIIGQPLKGQPALANHPNVAATLLAIYLRDKHARIKYAIFGGDLKQARKLVNGGSHGLDRFEDTFARGAALL